MMTHIFPNYNKPATESNTKKMASQWFRIAAVKQYTYLEIFCLSILGKYETHEYIPHAKNGNSA